MADNQISQPGQENVEDDDEISLLDLALVLAASKRLILGFPILVAIVAVIYSLTLPNIYTATTKILPPQQGGSAAAAALAQMGGSLGSLAGGAIGIKNPNDLYIGMLKSRTVADNLITRFKLQELYETKFQSATRKELESNSTMTAGKDGIIAIEFSDKDPKRAAEIANAYVDELFKLTQVLAVTEASQRRLFYEKQFALAKDNLARSEVAARQALGKGGIAMVDAQGKGMIETTARLRGQITVKEVQIGAMRAYAAEGNPELKALHHELGVMKGELAKLEGSRGERVSEASQGSQGLDSVRLLRDMKYHETIFELLAKQYELAKIDEAKDAAIIQVMDKAIEPDRRSKPKRALIVLVAALVALFMAIFWAFIRAALAKVRRDPEQAPKLLELSSALALRP